MQQGSLLIIVLGSILMLVMYFGNYLEYCHIFRKTPKLIPCHIQYIYLLHTKHQKWCQDIVVLHPSTHQVPKMVSRHLFLLFCYYGPRTMPVWVRWKKDDINKAPKKYNQKILIFNAVSGHIKIMNSAIFSIFQKNVKRFRETTNKNSFSSK